LNRTNDGLFVHTLMNWQ